MGVLWGWPLLGVNGFGVRVFFFVGGGDFVIRGYGFGRGAGPAALKKK